jgi:hypothetical protein
MLMEDLKDELRLAYRDGLVGLSEYLAELRKLNDDEHGEKRKQPGSASGEADAEEEEEGDDDGDEEELVDEDGNLFSSWPHSSPVDEQEEKGSSGSFDDDGAPWPSFDDEEELPEATPEATSLSAGDKAIHLTKGLVTVLRVGTRGNDFLNAGNMYITFQQVKKNCSKKMETVHLWAAPSTLRPLTEEEAQMEAATSETVPREIPSEGQAGQPEVVDVATPQATRRADADLPAGATHERGRVLPLKVDAPKRGHHTPGSAKCESKVDLTERLQQFPNQELEVRRNLTSWVLYCLCCKEERTNKWRWAR